MACGQAGSGCALKTRLSSGSNLSRSARTSTPAILRWLPGRVGTPQFCGVRHRNNAITPILPTKTAIRPGSSAARQRIGRWPDTSIRSWRWPGMSGCHQLGGSRYEGRLLGGPGHRRSQSPRPCRRPPVCRPATRQRAWRRESHRGSPRKCTAWPWDRAWQDGLPRISRLAKSRLYRESDAGGHGGLRGRSGLRG